MFVFFAASKCKSQSKFEFGTTKQEFDAITRLFSDSSDVPQKYDDYHEFNDLEDDTLSTGKWRGRYWGQFANSELSLNITQTFPYIKGTFHKLDTYIESEDTINGIIRGKNSNTAYDKIIIGFKSHEHPIFLLGKVLTLPNNKATVFFGSLIYKDGKEDDNVDDKQWKLVFLLYKQ